MVDAQVAARGVRDPRVLQAMRDVPRELFVAPGVAEFAYEDSALAIGCEQTISQPYIVAFMLEAVAVGPDDRVLEVGAGSGYAAALLARLADRVDAIERLPTLVDAARENLRRAGARVDVHLGDGTLGWPAGAPYDVIVVSAGGPVVPRALKDQLAIGGRLVIPVGDEPHVQRLVRVVRHAVDRWDEETLEAVRFVALVGVEGWADDERRPSIAARMPLAKRIARAASPLPATDDPDFASAFDRYAERRVVLLGEASHGTSEFYRARAAITARLVARHGFRVVAVEADWPDAAALDRVVSLRDDAVDDAAFARFPTWMWRNREVDKFVARLRASNAAREPADRARFYGLDIYNMHGSIAAVLAYLDRVDPDAATVARRRYGCLTPWQRDPATYGRAVLSAGYRNCEEAVIAQCRALLGKRLDYAGADPHGFLDAAQNARLVAAAEHYYRVMYYGGAASWNLRDTHMFETLEHLLDAHGPDAKAVVWAHNSHIGDARATEMGAVRDELNVGQLCRERFGDDVVAIGFGTHRGTVAAASDWDGGMEVMRVRDSQPGSVERLMHDSGVERFMLDLRADGDLRAALSAPRAERFIGVIYRPETEVASHYAEVRLAEQFDAYVWFDETTAVTPVAVRAARDDEAPDTFPFGV